MAEIKVRNGKMIRHEPVEEEKVRSSNQTNTVREVLKALDDKNAPTKSNIDLLDIPLDMIEDRPVNKFRMTGIEELAAEIEKDGLFQNIIVVPKEGGAGYHVSSGHRRIHAYRLLKKKYEQDHPGEENPYNKITVQVMSGLSEQEEGDVYLKTNSFSRNTTLMEAIANLNPEKMDFDDVNFKKEYLTYMYGPDAMEKYVAGEINDTLSARSLAEYVYRKVVDTYHDLECTPEAVRRYLRIYERCSDTVKDMFFKANLSIKQLMDITANFSVEEQELIFNSDDPDEKKKEILARHRKAAKKEKKKASENNPKQIFKQISKFTKPIIMLCEDLETIEENETNQEEIRKIKKLKEAINEFLN